MSATVPPDAAARNRSAFGNADQNQAQAEPPKGGMRGRRIDVTFKLGQGNFGEAGVKTYKVTGLEVHASIQKFPASVMNTAQVRIGGLNWSLINTLCTLGTLRLADLRSNAILLAAGDEDGVSEIYRGTIWESYPQMDALPNAMLVVQSQTAFVDQLKPIEPLSFIDQTDAVVIMQQIAKNAGYAFENAGVPPTMLTDQYLQGTAIMQADLVAEAGNFSYTVDDGRMVIFPHYGSPRQGPMALISPKTGMVGYPAFHSAAHVRVRTMFNKDIRVLGHVRVESDVRMATGEWRVMELHHELETETAGGQWFTSLGLDKIGVAS